jgi:membrane-associated PAP2 superfamily phosphatase
MTRRQFEVSILVLAALALLLTWLGRYTNVDLVLADAVFDFSRNEFPLRSHWFFDEFMHHTMKALAIAAGLVPMAALCADWLARRRLLEHDTRKTLMVIAASAVLVPLCVSALKAVSMHHCPWSLARYGGFEPYLRIFDSLPAGVSSGHCFPAGHASSALWIPSVALFWLPRQPAKALAMFILGLVPGLALGLSQQARGAHFLTHTLWSAWIAMLIIVVLARLAGASTQWHRQSGKFTATL